MAVDNVAAYNGDVVACDLDDPDTEVVPSRSPTLAFGATTACGGAAQRQQFAQKHEAQGECRQTVLEVVRTRLLRAACFCAMTDEGSSGYIVQSGFLISHHDHWGTQTRCINGF